MKANGKEDKAIHGIAVLGDKLYVVRDRCNEIEVYSMTGYKYEGRILVENLRNPEDIISHNTKNYLFIDDNKEGTNDPDKIIRITPNGNEGQEYRWSITDKNKLRIKTGRLSVTPDGNILIPLMNEGRLREYGCDGNLIKEIEILTPDNASYRHIRQAILLKSGYFVLSFGDGASEEKEGVFTAKLEGQKLKFIQDDTSSNKDNKNELFERQAEIDIPSHTITLDDLSILVADRENRRVLLFHVVKDTSKAEKPRLKYQRELLSKKNGLNKPYRLYLDKTSGCLFVADNEETDVDNRENAENGRILVYSVI